MGDIIVSFVIPTYNSERTIANCIKSILSQKAGRVKKEIIVVDDCSMDRTVEIVKGLGLEVIVKKRRSGVPESCNIGIRRSKGKLIALVDSDVYVCDGWLSAGLAEIEKGNDGVHPTNVAYQPSVIHQTLTKFSPLKPPFIPTFSDAALVKREVFDKIGLFDEWFAPVGGQDVEIALRALKAGLKIVHSDDAKFYHDYTLPRGLTARIKKVALYQSGRIKAWLMHFDYLPARQHLLSDWMWFLLYPFLLVLRRHIRASS